MDLALVAVVEAEGAFSDDPIHGYPLDAGSLWKYLLFMTGSPWLISQFLALCGQEGLVILKSLQN